MTTHKYDNPTTQDERREVLRNDTMLGRQANALDEAGGRFSRITPSKLNGTDLTPQFPKLPTSSPWHHEALPDEPPLGVDVSYMEPIEQPLDAAEARIDGPDPTTSVQPPAASIPTQDGAPVLKLSSILAADNSPSGAPFTPPMVRRL